LLVEDTLATRKLVNTLMKLVEDKSLKGVLSSNIKKLAVKDAADRIAEIALDLIK
jgi:UDP-N-acetylglucosamine:LPS N-acetylglucosamine transferase